MKLCSNLMWLCKGRMPVRDCGCESLACVFLLGANLYKHHHHN